MTSSIAPEHQSDSGNEQPRPKLLRPLNEQECSYFQGDKPPPTASFLLSNSKYLNNPLFRDAWCQVGLRRYGYDLPTTYDLPAVFRAIADVTDIDEFRAAVEEEKRLNPEFRGWVEKRKLPHFSREQLEACKPGTLGAGLAAFLSIPEYEYEFVRIDKNVDNDVDYILKRINLGHDIDHTFMGFSTSQLGEYTLALVHDVSTSNYFKCPTLAKNINLLTSLLHSAAIMRNSIHYPEVMPHMYRAIKLGIEAGLSLHKPVYMIDFEPYLNMTREEICEEVGMPYHEDLSLWDEIEHMTRG